MVPVSDVARSVAKITAVASVAMSGTLVFAQGAVGADESASEEEVSVKADAKPLDGTSEIESLINEVLIDRPELWKAGPNESPDLPIVKKIEFGAATELSEATEAEGLDASSQRDRQVEPTYELIVETASDVSLTHNPSGTAEFVDEANGVSSLLEQHETGARAFAILESAASAHSVEYGVTRNGSALDYIEMRDGSIAIGRGTTDDFIAVGSVEEPWAFDANGEPVDVAYRIVDQGAGLEMVVDAPSDATYPIVADPSLTFYAGETHCSWGSCTFYLERSKTYWLRDQADGVAAAAFIAVVARNVCAWLVAATSWSGPGAVVVGSSCAVAIALVAWKVKQEVGGSDARCLTFKSHHWQTAGIGGWLLVNQISHSGSSNSHCHYNV